MTLASLALTDFRSYAGATLPVSGGTVVLHGPNGAGKTNLLEAISLLTSGKGLRGATAADIEGLGEAVRADVLQKTGVQLDWEIKRIGRALS